MSGEASFSELLRQKRRAAGYSQEALAERSGLSTRTIAALEQGSRRAPYRDTVTALSDALHLSQDDRAQLDEAAAKARGRTRKQVSTLPTPLTSFVERSEVGEIARLLEEHRLVTISGSGGVGKTRVAIEVGHRIERSFNHVWFVDLLPLRDGKLLVPYIAGRLNVSQGSGDFLAAIVRELRSHRALVVFDNCEHLIGEAAIVLAILLQDCPQCAALVTSREPLGLIGEFVVRLPPMDAAAASELFVARARTQDGSLFFDTERLGIVAKICEDLDRIPLGIELAASRLSTLGFAELRKRSVRHQTIADTIQWSSDQLTDADRLVFERLSVFIGGFNLAAAEAVCADEFPSGGDIADVVPRLVQKSLIEAELIGTLTRYRFLETIRSFAWQRLSQKGDVPTTMLRFINWLKDEPIRLGTWYQSAEAVSELRRELDNLIASVGWAINCADSGIVVAAAYALMGFSNAIFGTARHEEIRQLAFGLLGRLHDDANSEAVGLLICKMAAFMTFEEIPRLAARAIPLLVATGHRPEAATLHARAAHCEVERGNAQAAEAHLIAGAPLLTQEERTQSNYGIHFSVESSYVHYVLGNFTAARTALEDLAIPAGYLQPRLVFAEIEFRENNFRKALQLLEEPMRELTAYPLGHPLRIMIFGSAAKCTLLMGDVSAAEANLRQALLDILDTSDRAQMFSSVFSEIADYAAVFAAKTGRVELAMRLHGACEASRNPARLDIDPHPTALLAPFLASLSPEQATALRKVGASEDLYDLIEEFLAN